MYNLFPFQSAERAVQRSELKIMLPLAQN